MAEPVLYQFPVTHFCEKVRWALDYKKIPFTTRNLLPLFHVPVVFRLTRQNQVPALELDNRYIAGSEIIIQTTEERFPAAPSLYPEFTEDRELALEGRRQQIRSWGRTSAGWHTFT